MKTTPIDDIIDDAADHDAHGYAAFTSMEGKAKRMLDLLAEHVGVPAETMRTAADAIGLRVALIQMLRSNVDWQRECDRDEDRQQARRQKRVDAATAKAKAEREEELAQLQKTADARERNRAERFPPETWPDLPPSRINGRVDEPTRVVIVPDERPMITEEVTLDLGNGTFASALVTKRKGAR